jgi:hypothetical protein
MQDLPADAVRARLQGPPVRRVRPGPQRRALWLLLRLHLHALQVGRPAGVPHHPGLPAAGKVLRVEGCFFLPVVHAGSSLCHFSTGRSQSGE